MIVPIVDHDDNVIVHKERDDLDLSNDIIRSASLWVTNSAGQVLLAQRKLTKKTDPGKWAEAVGGTVDGDDSYEDTVYREAQEELGIIGERFLVGPKQFVPGPPANYFVQWYYVNLDWPVEKFIPQDDEVEQVAWFDVGKLADEIANNHTKYIAALPVMIDLLLKNQPSS